MAPHAPLLSILRHRIRGIGLLFAWVMLGKLLVGGLCLADGAGAARAFPPAAVAAQEIDSAATVLADDGGECWHAGHGGCHCNCAHSAPVATQASMASAPLAIATRFAAPSLARGTPPPLNLLRPPIA